MATAVAETWTSRSIVPGGPGRRCLPRTARLTHLGVRSPRGLVGALPRTARARLQPRSTQELGPTARALRFSALSRRPPWVAAASAHWVLPVFAGAASARWVSLTTDGIAFLRRVARQPGGSTAEAPPTRRHRASGSSDEQNGPWRGGRWPCQLALRSVYRVDHDDRPAAAATMRALGGRA
jgi:hypothetical protein